MSLSEQVGQTIMVAQSSTQDSPAGRRAIERLHVGSVVLLGNSTAGRARTARLTDGLRDGVDPVDGVGLLVAADQEGGLVQRLQGPGFDRIPSAEVQAGWSDRTLRRRAGTWSDPARPGRHRREPRPRGRRGAALGRARQRSRSAPCVAGTGRSPSVVAQKTVAVVAGMHDGGTATAVKHFPGLGSRPRQHRHGGGRGRPHDDPARRPARGLPRRRRARHGAGHALVGDVHEDRREASRDLLPDRHRRPAARRPRVRGRRRLRRPPRPRARVDAGPLARGAVPDRRRRPRAGRRHRRRGSRCATACWNAPGPTVPSAPACSAAPPGWCSSRARSTGRPAGWFVDPMCT